MKNTADIPELILEHLSDAVVLTDSVGRFLYVNPAAEEAFRLPKEKLLGHMPEDLIKDGIYTGSTIMKVLDSKAPSTDIVDHFSHKRLSTSIPVLDDEGNLRHVLTVSRRDDVLNRYMELLEKEADLHSKYHTISRYLSRRSDPGLIWKSMEMESMISELRLVSPTDSTICLVGESGTGKELIAHYIHEHSLRSGEAFIPVNCSAIPPELFESEFFGYSEGAFTGASRSGKYGLVRMANKGTLFLDEIGDLPLSMQTKLLRFLEEREVRAVGSSKSEKVDVRVIAATNRNLDEMLAEGTFRRDLYYRLMIFPIRIPPLRERKADIRPLADYFLDRFGRKFNRDILLEEREYELLEAYNWPGNVRELRNVMERLALLSDRGNALSFLQTALALPEGRKEAAALPEGTGAPVPSGPEKSLEAALQEYQEQYIEEMIRKYEGDLQKAADALGIHRSTLYRKRKYRLKDPL